MEKLWLIAWFPHSQSSGAFAAALGPGDTDIWVINDTAQQGCLQWTTGLWNAGSQHLILTTVLRTLSSGL